MAFDKKPDDFLGSANYTAIATGGGSTLTGPGIFFKTSGATEGSNLVSTLIDTEIHQDTGDIREIIFGLCEAFFQKDNALATADKSNKMTITRDTFEDTTAGEFVRTYTFALRMNAPAFTVANES